MDKPRVSYEKRLGDPQVGHGIYLEGVRKHPRGLKGDLVFTSPIVLVFESGEFETENTIYYPENR